MNPLRLAPWRPWRLWRFILTASFPHRPFGGHLCCVRRDNKLRVKTTALGLEVFELDWRGFLLLRPMVWVEKSGLNCGLPERLWLFLPRSESFFLRETLNSASPVDLSLPRPGRGRRAGLPRCSDLLGGSRSGRAAGIDYQRGCRPRRLQA